MRTYVIWYKVVYVHGFYIHHENFDIYQAYQK